MAIKYNLQIDIEGVLVMIFPDEKWQQEKNLAPLIQESATYLEGESGGNWAQTRDALFSLVRDKYQIDLSAAAHIRLGN
ncbi:TPA: hypothetical protein HA242_04510 [Candidatus Woesearchaeota archaeon]|nr:hypothetical protein [Candidatus Woesearchaeota archaeon]HIH12960.1 hypothetical protein [Candidatus Woesearchaeota archaeon]